ncbi:MAG: shikimate dehydrogenase [Anaeromyxobacter sp.]
MKVTGHTAVYGVLGHPVAHSRSPAMQIAAFEACGIDAVYVALPVMPERIEEALKGAHALGFQGLNVTVPHKQRAAAACVTLDPIAREIGAANTLRRTALGWEGFNTDAPACRALLDAAGMKAGARALVVGAGGAARAAVWALLQAGAQVRIASRRQDSAEGLAKEAAAWIRDPRVRAEPAAFDALEAEAARCDVVVNATPIGLSADQSLPVTLRSDQIVVDFVYGETAFEVAAREAGAHLVSGEEILVRQGAIAFSVWTGRPAPEAAMAAAVAAGGKVT